MRPYRDPDHNSSIVGYDLEPDAMWVYFDTSVRYRYPALKIGAANLAEMRRLAEVVGNGLGHFIQTTPTVRTGFDRKEPY